MSEIILILPETAPPNSNTDRDSTKEELARLLIGGSDITVDRLSGLLRHLEPDGLTGLLLAHSCPIDRVTMRSNVLDLQADDVASAELAIDG